MANFDESVAASRPAMVPAGPGRWRPRAGEDAPKTCICRWVQLSDGSFRPEPFPYRWVQVTPALLAELGFAPALEPRARRETLQRLAAAGFVRLARISPGVTLLDLDSWQEHMWRCLSDPDYWERDGAAYRKYELANFTRKE